MATVQSDISLMVCKGMWASVTVKLEQKALEQRNQRECSRGLTRYKTQQKTKGLLKQVQCGG